MNTIQPRIGLLGVGRMGSGMARNLLAKGFTLVMWDPEPRWCQPLVAAGAVLAHDVGDVAAQSDIVLSSLPSSAALAACVQALRQYATARGSTPLVVVETSTLPLADKFKAREDLASSGIDILDAPLIGGAMQAKEGTLTVLASGLRAHYETCLPMLRAISAQQHYIGAFGESTKLKLVVNHLVGITNVLVAETISIAKQAGLELDTVQNVIGTSPAGSGLWRARVPLMLAAAWDDEQRQSGELNIPLKDNSLITDFIAHMQVATPLFDAVQPVYELARQQGRAQQDPAALLPTLESMAQARDRVPS